MAHTLHLQQVRSKWSCVQTAHTKQKQTSTSGSLKASLSFRYKRTWNILFAENIMNVSIPFFKKDIMVKPVLSQRCRCCLSLHWDKRRCCFNTRCCAALWTGCKWYSKGTDTWTNCSSANPPHINNIHWKNEGSSKPRNLCIASLCIYYCNAPHCEQPGHMFVEGRSELRKDKRMQIEDSTNRHSWKEWKCASEKKGNKACSSWREPFQHLQDPYAYSCIPYNLSFLHIIFFSWFFFKHSQESFWNFSKKVPLDCTDPTWKPCLWLFNKTLSAFYCDWMLAFTRRGSRDSPWAHLALLLHRGLLFEWELPNTYSFSLSSSCFRAAHEIQISLSAVLINPWQLKGVPASTQKPDCSFTVGSWPLKTGKLAGSSWWDSKKFD